jgi:PKD domain/Secretion system C-terminal sorting domain
VICKKIINMKKALLFAISLFTLSSAFSQIIISGSLDNNTKTVWTNNNIYILQGFVRVTANDTLEIQPGTIIKGDFASKGSLIIERDGYLIANGTETSPIVFTSQKPVGQRAYGDWGGLIICGRASVNQPANAANGTSQGEAVVEGGVGSIYGGGTNPDDLDNSGVIRYVRIEFGGIPFQPNSEINGLTMCGVGSGTTIDHIQISYCGDDAFEWFGGTVNCRNLIAYRNWDDDFDTDFGYRGHVQFALSVRDPQIADQSGSNGFESDNDATGSTNTPKTQPKFSNVTIIGGPALSPDGSFNSLYKRSGHLRRNTECSIFNSVLVGYPIGLLIEAATTQSNATNGLLRIKNNMLVQMQDTLIANTSSSLNAATNNINSGFNITNFYNSNNNGTINNASSLLFKNLSLNQPDLSLQGGSPLSTGADFSDSYLNNSFFTPVTFRGAFGSENWATCWTEFDPQNEPYNIKIDNSYTAEITPSGNTTFCQGGSVDLLASASSNNVTFTWNNGSNNAIQSITTSGTYSAMAVNSNGCSVSINPIDVTVNSNPIVNVSASGNTTFCQGGSITLSSSQNGNHLWSNGATGNSIFVTQSGTYSTTFTDSNGCSGSSNSIAITVNALPNVSITSTGNTTLCQGQTVTISSSQNTGNNWSNGGIDNSITVGTTGNYSTTYTDNNGCSATSNSINVIVNALPQVSISANGNTSFCTGGNVTLSSNQTAGNLWSNGLNTADIEVTSTGNYSVVVTDNNGCQNTSNIISVSVSDAPAPTASVSGNNIFCAGQSAEIQSSTADSYQWYLNGTAINGANSASINVTEGGFYTVETTNSNACNGTGFSNPVFITVNALPNVSLTAIGNTTFCEGNQITLLCNQGTGTVWSNGAIDVNSSTISSSGSYSVSFTDNNGCFGTSNAIDVTVNANPTVSITANGPTTFCNGGSVTLSSSATGNNSWTGGSSANSIDVSASGTYELTYTDVNGCQAMTSTTVTVNDQPTADFSILQNNGSLVIQFLNNSNNATSYSWDFGDGTTSQETNPSHLYNAGGNYTVTLTATNGDCVDTFVFDVMNVSTDELSHLSVSVYPNPASQQLTLIAPAQSQLIIFDVTGKMVMSILTQQTNTEINLNDFSAGLYFVKGYNAQGFFTTKFEKR